MKLTRLSLVLFLLLGILIVILRVAFVQNTIQNDVTLEQIILQPDELPKNTKWVTSIAIEADDPRNPIEESIRTAEFLEARHVFVWSPKNPENLENSIRIPVINVTFKYATEAEAMAQWQMLVAFMENYEGGEVLATKNPWFSQNKGFSAQFVGEEGDVIHWFVCVKDNFLIVLIVDNLEAIVNEDVANSFGYGLFLSLSELLLKR